MDIGVDGVGGNRPVQFWRCRVGPAPDGVERPGGGGVSNPPREGDEGYGLAEPRRRRPTARRVDWGGDELVAGSGLDGRTSGDDTELLGGLLLPPPRLVAIAHARRGKDERERVQGRGGER